MLSQSIRFPFFFILIRSIGLAGKDGVGVGMDVESVRKEWLVVCTELNWLSISVKVFRRT